MLLTKLCKYDGQKTGILSARDFHQISGRAGRKGFDTQGFVISQAPEHVIENRKLEQKAKLNPKKKYVKAKPPEKGFIAWNEETFQNLVKAAPEKLRSSFQINHGLILNVLSQRADGCSTMKRLIRHSHESDSAKIHHRKRAFQLFRALVDKKIVEFIPKEEQLDDRKVRVNIDLQEDFSLDQALSLYLLDALNHLDPFIPEYPYQLLTLVESILESPTVILHRQLDMVKRDKIAELKMQGMDYDDRLNELEKLEHPKPMADFIYSTFNDYSAKHPWIGQDNIRPKSIARDIYERYCSFGDYIREYGLERAEGVLLRYVSDVYRVLSQTIPDILKNDAVDEMILFFETMLKTTDSSLVSEWKRLSDLQEGVEGAPIAETPALPSQTPLDAKCITILIRNTVFQFLKALAARDYETLLALLTEGDEKWMAEKFEACLAVYYQDHSHIALGPDARSPKNTRITGLGTEKITAELMLTDPDQHNDWHAVFEVRLALSEEEPKLILVLDKLGPIGDTH